MSTRPSLFWVFTLSLATLAVACGGDDGDVCPPVDTSYDPAIDAADFVDAVDNPLFALVPGSTYQYMEGTNAVVDITVLPERKVILGVSCTVVHDVVTIAGDVAEDTIDWYAQDSSGAVWYFGEATMELRLGRVVSTEGSWEAGCSTWRSWAAACAELRRAGRAPRAKPARRRVRVLARAQAGRPTA